MSEEPNWIVYRFSDDLPDEYRAPELDGQWVDRSEVPEYATLQAKRGDGPPERGECVAVATGRFEVDLDGKIGEVYEIRPLWKIDLT